MSPEEKLLRDCFFPDVRKTGEAHEALANGIGATNPDLLDHLEPLVNAVGGLVAWRAHHLFDLARALKAFQVDADARKLVKALVDAITFPADVVQGMALDAFAREPETKAAHRLLVQLSTDRAPARWLIDNALEQALGRKP